MVELSRIAKNMHGGLRTNNFKHGGNRTNRNTDGGIETTKNTDGGNQEIEGCAQSAVKELVSLALADDLSRSGCSRVLDVTSPQVSSACTDLR